MQWGPISAGCASATSPCRRSSVSCRCRRASAARAGGASRTPNSASPSSAPCTSRCFRSRVLRDRGPDRAQAGRQARPGAARRGLLRPAVTCQGVRANCRSERRRGSLHRQLAESALPRSFIYRLAGRNRENSASYYTPEPLARVLVKYALKDLLADKKADDILKLRIVEPAMGSAAFLVEVVNQLADRYLELKQIEVGTRIPTRPRIRETKGPSLPCRPQRLRRRPQPHRGRARTGVPLAELPACRRLCTLVRGSSPRRKFASREPPCGFPRRVIDGA